MKINSNDLTKLIVDNIIKIAFLAFLIGWCFLLISPFFILVLWAVLISVILHPLYISLVKKLGGRKGLSAFLITLSLLAIVMVPTFLFMGSLVEGAKNIGAQLQLKEFVISPPNESVKDWPAVGTKIYEIWALASENIQDFIEKYSESLAKFGRMILDATLGTTLSVFKFVLSIIIAGVMLTYSEEGNSFSKKLFVRIAGKKGEDLLALTNGTVRNVAKGVIGVALIQGFLVGLGLLFAGIPYAGLWALLCFILALIQLPVSLVVIPIIFYMFSIDSGVMTVIWTIYLLLAGASDNLIKPILLGKGSPVPMLVIFLGVMGGFITSGFIGMFVGAIVLSVGYKLMISWVNEK